jgi:light-regulated signal transduction histidine kinase (bacteriophytochrome)
MSLVVILFVNGVSLVLAVFLLWERKKRENTIEKLKSVVKEKDTALANQAKDLKLLYERSKTTHKGLQQEVNVRTANLDRQNRKLVEHVYFYSYRLRVPLEKISAALLLIRLESNTDPLRDLVEKLTCSTEDMDRLIDELTRKIDTEIQIPQGSDDGKAIE